MIRRVAPHLPAPPRTATHRNVTQRPAAPGFAPLRNAPRRTATHRIATSGSPSRHRRAARGAATPRDATHRIASFLGPAND